MYTIYAPDRWYFDIHPAMEDWQTQQQEGTLSEADAEVVEQYWDRDRRVKRGRGGAHRFDLTSLSAVRFLRNEAGYRADYNKDLIKFGDADGAEERAYARSCMRAAEALLDRCDAVLAAAEKGE